MVRYSCEALRKKRNNLPHTFYFQVKKPHRGLKCWWGNTLDTLWKTSTCCLIEWMWSSVSTSHHAWGATTSIYILSTGVPEFFTCCIWSTACCWASCLTGTSWSPPMHPSGPSETGWHRWGSELPLAGRHSRRGQSWGWRGPRSKCWPDGGTAQRGSWGWRGGGCIWWSWWRCQGSGDWAASPYPGPHKADWTPRCGVPSPLPSDLSEPPSAGPEDSSTSWLPSLLFFSFLKKFSVPSCQYLTASMSWATPPGGIVFLNDSLRLCVCVCVWPNVRWRQVTAHLVLFWACPFYWRVCFIPCIGAIQASQTVGQ